MLYKRGLFVESQMGFQGTNMMAFFNETEVALVEKNVKQSFSNL